MFSQKILKSNRRRPFQIVIGLMEGYGSTIIHSVDEVKQIIKDWMAETLVSQPMTITGGTLIPGTTIYAWNTELTGVKTNEEQTVLFVGEINPLYCSDMSDEQAIECLKSLATRLGENLNQTRMYVSYCDTIYIYQDNRQDHPTES